MDGEEKVGSKFFFEGRSLHNSGCDFSLDPESPRRIGRNTANVSALMTSPTLTIVFRFSQCNAVRGV